ncbi:alpha/beta hydrolase [Lactobacillus acidophilus]|uniref:alpha/beta hydrolase n=1 Tax=Lactobacillus acidophilus TaxID=1579 RepID=UPI0021A57DCE|nr:alpha/beta hydrolase-fold protein [Lactobacillus acidophilus]
MKRKKAPLLMTLLASTSLLAACGQAASNSNENGQSQAAVRKSTDSQSEIIKYTTTHNRKKYTKQAIVYLPKNYNAKEKHNILYLLHGSTEVNNGRSTLYQDGNFKRTFDDLSDRGELKNTIVVFPTYYPSSKQVSSNYYDDNPLNRRFAKTELMHDLVPAVEKRYKTYATKKQLEKSRNHRAFGGFSMGSITTWYVFQYDLPYFKYFVSMAGDSWTVTSDGGSAAPRRTAQVLANAAKKNSNLSFKIFAGVGSGDGTSGSMEPQIRAMWNLPQFNRNNLEYYTQPGGNHDAPTMSRIINHYGKELFK